MTPITIKLLAPNKLVNPVVIELSLVLLSHYQMFINIFFIVNNIKSEHRYIFCFFCLNQNLPNQIKFKLGAVTFRRRFTPENGD